MARKEGKGKSSSQKKNASPEKTLIENFVTFQSVMADLSMKLDKVATQMAKLLELFEKSAKTIAEKDFGVEKDAKDTKKIIEKLDDLADQNKTIARGLTLLHEKEGNVPEEDEENQPPQKRQPQNQQKPPQEQQKNQNVRQEGEKRKSIDMGEYQKSISSGEKERMSRAPPSENEQRGG